MKKSFKKSIAVLLAVLMVVCAFPLTTFAAEKPNVNIQFGVLSVSKTDKRTYSTNRTASTNASTISGLMSAKLDYNKSAGTITDSADSYTYAVGDYFTATVLLENVSQLAATQVAINYSSNIIPAGICDGDKKLYGAGDEVGTVSDKFKAGEPIAAQSGNAIYNTTKSTVGELSYIDMSTNTMYAYFAAQDGSAYVSTASTSIGANTFSNTAVLATFAFKITAEGPISFSLANTTDVDEAYYLATLENGGNVSEYITYAPTENAGSTGLDFMGGNEYVATTKHTIVFKNEDGTVISSTEYDEGAVIAVPDLPAVSKDDTNHYTYAWDVTPSTTAVADATYQVVKTGAAHIWGEGVVTKEPTATENGERTYTCTFDGCGATKTEVIPATGETHTHTWGEWVYNGDAVYVSGSNYTDGTATRTCACGETETKTIAGTGLLRARTATCEFASEVRAMLAVKEAQIKQFAEVYCKFTREDGEVFIVKNDKVTVVGSNYYYPFGVTPQSLHSDIKVQFYGVTADGITTWGQEYTYNMAKNYIVPQLTKSTDTNWKTLLVELVYYGYENQVEANWKLDQPLTDLLTAEQKALHTTEALTLNKYQNTAYVTCENPETTWRAVNAEFGAVTSLMFRTRALTVTDDLKAVVVVDGEAEPYTYHYNDPKDAECFIDDGAGGIYFKFIDLPASRLRSKVYVTLYKGDTPIINTFEYSAETYCKSQQGKGTQLERITDQLMRYANAARAYFGVTD